MSPAPARPRTQRRRLTADAPRVRRIELEGPGLRPRSFDLEGPLPPAPRVAIVGSRAARREALERVPSLLRALRRSGRSLVSGGALGVDAAAHRAALELALPQVAVLPCARGSLYPTRNAMLFAAMREAEEASLLFALEPGQPQARGVFASRNRVVVALASAVIVAQAGARSGSVGTGRLAHSLGVPLAVLPGSPGCAQLVELGARPLPPDDSLGEFVEAWLSHGGAREGLSAARWPAHLRWLAEPLSERGRSLGELLGPRVPGEVLLALAEAEAMGLVAQPQPGRWIALHR